MADIQPKNTDTIRVNTIKEKTASAGITLDNVNKVDDIREKTASAGVLLNQVVKVFLTPNKYILPVVSDLTLGSSTLAEHFLIAYARQLLSSTTLTVGTLGADALNFKTANVNRATFSSTGSFEQDASNGSHLKWDKASTGPQFSANYAITSLGSTIADAVPLTGMVNRVTSGAVNTGVQLWDAPQKTYPIWVFNDTGNTIKLYPNSALTQINGAGAGTAISVSTGQALVVMRTGASDWYAKAVA